MIAALPWLAVAGDKSQPRKIEDALDLASKRRCEEALPLLQQLTPGIADKQLRYKAQIATIKCAIKRKQDETAARTLLDLRRDNPDDPETLYLTTQFFLDLAVRTSQHLSSSAPSSYQNRLLQAETLESQNKWDQAVEIYKKILEEKPDLPNIHFRIARAAMVQPSSPASTEEARRQLEQELVNDPNNASAEFWLGEIARGEGDWDKAIPHYAAAAKLDPSFSEASLGLGITLNSAGRYSDAIDPLEKYVKVEPDDPAGHYQLAMAYARSGRKDDSAREMEIQRQLSEKREQATPSQQGDSAPH